MIVMRCALRESVKKNVRDFTGSEEYKVGDLSKEADARVKAKVAELRGKEEYEVRLSVKPLLHFNSVLSRRFAIESCVG